MPAKSKLRILCVIGLVSSLAGADQPASKTALRRLRLPAPPYVYRDTELPKHVQDVAADFDNTPADNPITDDGATLGRVLFYDPTLSRNGQTSCASCHQQQFAFTDQRRRSLGFQGHEVARNSMSLVNVRYYPSGKMFWDERASSLEAQVLMPIEDRLEMGHQLPDLVVQLQQDPLYPPLFRRAFGDDHVSSTRIARALAQFVRSIVSFRSKYDVGRSHVDDVLAPFPNFSEQENYGKAQFFGRANCASCHLEPAASRSQPPVARPQSAFFFVRQATVNGIDSLEPQNDAGLGRITGRDEDQGKFKVASLRNVEVTGPYMHDGRFHTLDQVLEHYNWSVRPHPNLDPRLANHAVGLGLPEREKVALTQFLLTLTDHELLSDPKFSDPFPD